MGTFIAVVVIDIDHGIVIGLAISLFMVVVKDQIVRLSFLVEYSESSGRNFVNKDLVIGSKNTSDVIMKHNFRLLQKFQSLTTFATSPKNLEVYWLGVQFATIY